MQSEIFKIGFIPWYIVADLPNNVAMSYFGLIFYIIIILPHSHLNTCRIVK